MKTIFASLLFPGILLAQFTKGIVKDSVTQKPIAYANIWVEGEDISAMADSLGQYSIRTTNADKTLVFSAAGYHPKKIKLPQTRGLTLAPIHFQRPFTAAQGTETQTLGASFKTRHSDLSFGNHGKPWMIARKFTPLPTKPSVETFLKELELYTESHTNNMKLSLRFSAIDDDGNPGRELFDSLVICRVDRGRGITKVDLVPYGIRFPENGLFVAVSWLIIPQNVKTWYDRRPMQFKDYDPGIGAMPSASNSSWQYLLGRWKPVEKFEANFPIRAYRGKFPELAMRLTLSN